MAERAFCPHCGERLRSGAMEPLEFKTVRTKLGLRVGAERPISRWAFSKLLGVSQTTIQNYESGSTLIPRPIAQKVERLLAKPPAKLRIPGRRRKVTLRRNRRVEWAGGPDAPLLGELIEKPKRQRRRKRSSLERASRKPRNPRRRVPRPPRELVREWANLPTPDVPEAP